MKQFNNVNFKQMNKHNRNFLPNFKRKDNSVNCKKWDHIDKKYKNTWNKVYRTNNKRFLNYITSFKLSDAFDPEGQYIDSFYNDSSNRKTSDFLYNPRHEAKWWGGL